MGINKKGRNPEYINDFSNSLLDGFYLQEGETFDDGLARAAEAYCFGDYALAQRIYDAAWNGWFMFASPILSNAPKGEWSQDVSDFFRVANDTDYGKISRLFRGDETRGLPISCFSIVAPDSIDGQIETMKELASLSVSGGGVGVHNQIRAVSKKAPGPIPFEKVLDGEIGYFKQASVRRGATAYYMDIDHPDIVEHIQFRLPTGGDRKRRSDNLTQFHSAVNVTQKFIDAVINDDDFDLVCPHSGEVRETLRARYLWELLLETRSLTGEPFIMKSDTVNAALPQTQKDLGLKVLGSNICSEVTLPTSEERSFVCCLSSLNIEKYDEWATTGLVADLVTFLDNVIQWFIEKAPSDLEKTRFSAFRERAIGIGAMGWHRYLQRKGIAFEGGGFNSAIQHTHIIFKNIQEQAIAQSLVLGEQRGEAPDMEGTGRRNSHLIAIAPNSNSGIILGTSPSIEPESGVAYMQNTRAGTHRVENQLFQEILDSENPDPVWQEKQWSSIIKNDGSVQHLPWLSDELKKLFLTAYEIDQHWIIEQADARQQYICQSQSVNLFFPAGATKAYYNSVHLKAMKAEYLKTLYYSRTRRSSKINLERLEVATLKDWNTDNDDGACISCEG